jgi:hypothetical protein
MSFPWLFDGERCKLIYCFNGERRKRNKDMKGITDTKNGERVKM